MFNFGDDDEEEVDDDELGQAYRDLTRPDEPFRFSIYREDGEVVHHSLNVVVFPENREMWLPIVVGSHGGGRQLWFEYLDTGTFEFVQKEEVIPSNRFYQHVAEIQRVAEDYNDNIQDLDNEAVQTRPNLPRIPRDMAKYERAVLSFMHDIILEHYEFTGEISYLVEEATRRYPDEDENEGENPEDGE